jgi:hypothetical protein
MWDLSHFNAFLKENDICIYENPLCYNCHGPKILDKRMSKQSFMFLGNITSFVEIPLRDLQKVDGFHSFEYTDL